MAKLIFRYGAMGTSKSANLLAVRFNYMERGMKVALLKPESEDRDGEMTVKSRIGIEAEADDTAEHFTEVYDRYPGQTWRPDVKWPDFSVVLVDEAQFLSADTVDRLSDIVDTFDIPVICYGLRTDFQGNLFSGSERLLAIADEIEEIPTICWCGKKARFNARVVNGRAVKTGEQIMLGGNDRYVPLCRKHFKSGDLGPKYVRELPDWAFDK